ncbi:MAG: hypothetical protein ACJ762_08290 [Solirubrobacteraceae bacterium]
MRSVRAPDALRARIAAETDRTLVRRTIVKRMKLSGALAAAAACLGIVVGLASLGGSDDPSALAAANLATRGAVAAAPAVDPANGKVLTARVDNVSFPVWADRFPWKAKGIRTDELEGRKTTTVFYDDPQGVRLGYTIVAGEALDWPQDSRRVVRNGIEVRTTTQDGRIVAFWREHGHTCVISAPDTVPEDRMITLASSGYV